MSFRASFPGGGSFPKFKGSRVSGGRTEKGSSVRFSATGLEEVAKRFEAMGIGIDDVMHDCLQDILTEVMEESQQLVPFRTGFLHDSARVILARRVKARWAGTIVYQAFYAMWIHEALWMYHKPPTCAKFLEIPFARRKFTIAAELKQRIREELMG